MLLKKSSISLNSKITIGGSKSISNRLLILKALFNTIPLENLSTAEDTQLLAQALEDSSEIIDVHHAGTAMRFLTAYYAIQTQKNIILTGSPRLQQRPIGPLVEALQSLGAKISYLDKEGYPPLQIKGSILKKNVVSIEANISSQFITALMLIGAALPNGLTIHLTGKITSLPYILMTQKILKDVGISTQFDQNTVRIDSVKNLTPVETYFIESDWSSASYYYSFAAIGRKKIELEVFKKNSLQGDATVVDLYKSFFGIETYFQSNTIILQPLEKFVFPERIEVDLNHCPDIAQTLCVTAAALKIPFYFTGLETLKIKETDRLQALKNELTKIGCTTKITSSSIESIYFDVAKDPIEIETYQDHRMAMAFAPYCLVSDIMIYDEQVVEKSYPSFWSDVEKLTTI